MTNSLKALLVVAVLFLSACAPMMNQNAIRTNYRTDDLNQDFLKAFKVNSNYFYKFDPEYKVDYMVSMVRMNVFSSPTTRYMGEMMLSLGLVGKKNPSTVIFFTQS